ncbi:acyltransferase [Rhodococcus globerulus]|uniref:acyltransferase family protein n=1 Tax=Rhodococcus globerulus TaxID=33008 RepID=UPI0030170686
MIPTLRSVFDPRLNALNAVRLAMATGVIVWHSYPLTGHDIGYAPLRQALAETWVDGFFAISGFLITASWVRNPNVRVYVTARLLRILPAFYTCLLITAFVVAPLGVAMQGGDWIGLLSSFAPIEYVISNLGVWIFERGVGGTPTGVPHPGTWNGSLWTLGWEALCYLGVLILGVMGLLRRQWTIPIAFAGAWLLLVVTLTADVGGHPAAAARFAIMFLAGAVIYQFQDRLPCTPIIVTATLGITAMTMFLPDYRLLGALPLAYTVISMGALIKNPRLVLKNDISYGVYIYAFPIQQLLYIALGGMTPLVFAAIATALTVPVAATSWYVVEKPAMKLRQRLSYSPVSKMPKVNDAK